MNDLLIPLVLTALAGAIAPVLILPVIFLLGTKNALRNAVAYAVAALCLYAAIGTIGIFFIGGQVSASESELSRVSAFISLGLGGLSLLFAALQLRSAADDSESLNKRVQGIESIGSGKAFGLGLAMPLFGAKNLMVFIACLNLIVEAKVGALNSLIAMLLVLLIFAPQMLIPIAIYAVVSERAARALAAIQNWVLKNNRAISIGACLLVGIILLAKGLAELVR